jgi:hypothetical protein
MLVVAALLVGFGLAGVALADQENMHEALDALEKAKRSLQATKWNDAPRKKRALDAIDQAIEQTRQGMQEARDDD